MSSPIWPIVGRYLRQYQKDWLTDFSRYRVYNKSRRVGISDTGIALESVLTSAGLIPDYIKPADCNVISRRQQDAKGVIRYAKTWVRRLSKDPQLAARLEFGEHETPGKGGNSKTEIRFARTGYGVVAETQNEGAGRSATGHLYVDEAAHCQWIDAIWTGAVPLIQSDPRHRLTVVSTPNGTSGIGGLFYELNREAQWDYFSRHETTLSDAIAQGFPGDIEEIRRTCKTTEIFLQEYMCAFIGAANEYFTRDFLARCVGDRGPNAERVWIGVDVASVIDMTAITVLRYTNARLWIGDLYMISRLDYESSAERAGQDRLLASVIWKHRPEAVILDATGDGAKLFAALHRENLPAGTRLIAHTVKHEWKMDVVPEMKGAMSRGRLLFERDAPQRFLAHAGYERLQAHKLDQLTEESAAEIHDGAFALKTWGDTYRSDFQKVRKVLTRSGLTTYETGRDSAGHGDSYWSATFAFQLARGLVGVAAAVTGLEGFEDPNAFDGPILPDFTDYM